MQAISSTSLSPSDRLNAVRDQLRRHGLDAFIVPRADEHQGEYIPACSSRLAWLTGFTGSAGAAVVMADRAAVFVDGRYTLQAEAQVDAKLYEHCHLLKTPPAWWLASHVKSGQRVGYDPWLHTAADVRSLQAALAVHGAEAVPVDANLVDAAWEDRPAPPHTPVKDHPLQFAGRPSDAKRKALAEDLRERRLSAFVLSTPDAIAWLLNVRGNDVPHTPLALSFAIVYDDATVDWFIEPDRVSEAVASHVGHGVRIRPRLLLLETLDGMKGRRVGYDPTLSADILRARLAAAGAAVVEGPDPCMLPKACKNEAELEGARAAHRRDGAALCRFLAWVDRTCGTGKVGEIEASDKLESFRRELPELLDLSFDTISGAGPNGAIVHYRAMPETERKITPGELYLIDSGAQYADGTTDVTRTVAIGTPPADAAFHYTLVLRGHIALARARFPAGISGHQLDALARLPLWEQGLDYDHGTGHGVGSYLAVHEGPQRIAKQPNSVPLQAGMIVSNEPGYYRTGHYGIRIENLVVVVPEGSGFGFETLTLAPMDRRLILKEMLSPTEVAWVNDYHERVRTVIGPLVDEETRRWLEEATRPL